MAGPRTVDGGFFLEEAEAPGEVKVREGEGGGADAEAAEGGGAEIKASCSRR